MKYRDIDTTPTQRERSDEREVKNSAGGYVYEAGMEDRVRRFLILGSEGGSFYASERDLTKQNLDMLKAMAREKPLAMWRILREVNEGNLAPRHSTVLLGLAVLHALSDPHEQFIESGVGPDGEPSRKPVQARSKVRVAIEADFDKFVRTGTHLFEFVDYVTMFRSWGSGLHRLITGWYTGKEADKLAYQVVKYRQRGGWTHADLLRKVKPSGVTGPLDDVLGYAARGVVGDVPDVIREFEAVKRGEMKGVDARTLTWEMLPTEDLTKPETWRALIVQQRLPYTAMMRNLGRMTALGVFDDVPTLLHVADRLQNAAAIERARIHPFNVLTAMKTYSTGHGFRGSLQWTPKRQITDALDAAFYAAFKNIEPSGKRTLLALDVSGSMGCNLMDSNVSAREGSTAMAMASMAADPGMTDVVAFSSAGWGGNGATGPYRNGTGLVEVDLSPRRRLDDNIRETRNLPFGGTDCALPMLYALEHEEKYDIFVVYTDSETWAGKIQPMEALRRYRKAVNPEARLVVVGMTSNGFTIADPQDQGALDLVGFDASAPRVIVDFTAGRI